MKKLLSLAAVFAVIGSASAASLNWNISTVYQPGTTTLAQGYTAYLFITEQSGAFGATVTTVDSVVSAIKAGDDLTDYIAATGTTSDKGLVSGATGYYNSFGAGDSLTAFAVIVDASDYKSASNYIVTAAKSASWTSSTGAKMLAFGTQANATWTAVPEPSTAVLALAGLALLLKRRRA